MNETKEPDVRSVLHRATVDQISSSPDQFALHLEGEFLASHYQSPFDHVIHFDRQGLIAFARKLLARADPDASTLEDILQTLGRIEQKLDLK